MKIIRGLIKKPLDAGLYLLAAIIIVKLASLYFQVNPDDSQWNQFKLDHHCQLQVNGSGTQRSSWICDDGKTYYRWRQQR